MRILLIPGFLWALTLGGAAAAETVTFLSAAVPPSPLKVRLAKKLGKPEPEGVAGEKITAILKTPSGRGPFPTVLAFPARGGWRFTPRHWTGRLVDWGYAVLEMRAEAAWDRTLAGRPLTVRGARPNALVRDAVGAIRFLRTRRELDAERVAVLGWSWGGTAALKSAEREGWMQTFGERPKAVAAFYPHCDSRGDYVIPALVLVGGQDRESLARVCAGVRDATPEGGRPMDLVIFPGAHHKFDDPQAPSRKVGGTYSAYDPKAAQAAVRRVREFLAQYL